MSGGHFDYNQYRCQDMAGDIDESLDEWGDRKGRGYPSEIIEKFREASHALRQAGEMAQRVDWLVSGDDGYDSFLERWEEEVRLCWKEKEIRNF